MDENLCPECGGKMVSRTNSQTGQAFWGCAKYPKCKGTRNTEGESRSEQQARAYDSDGDSDLPSERVRRRDRSRW